MFEAWKRSLDATIEVPDCEPAINAPSPRGKREPRVGGGGRRRTTPLVQACRRRRRRRGIESFLSKEGGRDEHVVREGEGRGGGKGWLCLAVKARVRGRGSSPSFEEYGSKEAGSISSSRILISRTEGGGKGGGREVDRLATNLPMFEGRRERKKGEKGKGTRERGVEREIEGVSLPPTPCFASTRKRYRRALPMKVMVNNATECY